MQTITWLHISDLHTNNSKHGWEYDKITDKLVNDLEKMRENHRLVPDFIFFTGDAAFGLSDNAPEENLAEQYARTHDFLEAIRTRYGNNISKENMFIVPGNHDVNINKHLPGLISWLKEPHSLDDVHDIIHKGGDFWRQFMDKLSDYNEFLKTYGYNHLVEGEGDGVRIPDRGIYCIIRKRHGITMAIVGLNSPWSSAGDGPSECGELRLGGERQLGFLYNTLKKADFAIALMHHPVNWFAPDENPSFEDNLRESFKFFLHGHEHANNVVLNEQYTRIGAGACYEHDTKETGYNFVRLNLHEKTGEIWLREYDKRYGGKWKPCVAGVKTNNDGRRLLKESVAWLGDLHVPSPVSGKRENQASKPELCSYVVIISGKFADTNREEILAFCQHLKRLLSDPLLTLRSFGHGSIVLLLQGEKKGYERLLKMISEGKLRDINGREIQKCYLYQEPDLGVASYPPVSTGALKTNKSQRSIPFDLTQQPAAFPGLYAVQGQFIQDVFLGSQMIVQQAQYPEPIQISQSRYRRETRDEIEERTEITYQIPGSQAFREGVAAIPALGFGGYSMTEPMKGKKSEAISRTFAGMSGRPPIQLFRQLPGASPDMPMVKAGLDTPSLQGGFIPTSMHTKFLDKYDPTQSYCFRTGEKTGKTSWLGYLAQYLISGFDQAYEPVWVNSIPEGYDAYAILTESLTRQKDYFQGRKPILFVDNLHLQPNLIAAIPRLRASKSVWREVPICCTYLSSPPEKGSWRAAWDESKGVWPMAEKFFEERRDVPGHMMVSDKDGKLTEDGKTLLEAVAKNLDQERADLLRPVFEEPQKEVPYAWLAFYVVENFSRGRAEAEQWIYENRVKMAQEKLYQVTWSGSERHQDIIRAAAFLSPTARDLLVQFCSRLRQEPEEQIEEHLDRILDLGDIWDEEEKWPFSHDKVTYFDMQDGLMTLALMPENFSKASQQRYSDILLECVAPGTKAGERAAILARTFTREDREFQNRLCERLANADLSLAGELFLFCMARFVEEFDSAELVNSLAQAMMAKAPPRWRAMWAGALSSVRARLQDLKRDVMVKALYEKVVSTLELDWNEEGDLAEAGVALANFYMDEKSWDQALSWWERIEERIEVPRSFSAS
jgi:3',5'-cyclic AMP phosphodiesterase CpdA